MSIRSIGKEDASETAWERTVRQAVRTLKYGSVEVVVHDGRVVQIETRERVRFAEAGHRPPDDRGREAFHESRADRATGAEARAKAGETER
jgi:hypothetical protein